MFAKWFRSLLIKVVVFFFAVSIAGAIYFALAANMVIPQTYTGRKTRSITANEVKPDACIGINLYDVISGTTGTAFNDLLIGTSGNDILDGGDGSDCLVGGAGDDTCIGTPDDVFVGCETISPP